MFQIQAHQSWWHRGYHQTVRTVEAKLLVRHDVFSLIFEHCVHYLFIQTQNAPFDEESDMLQGRWYDGQLYDADTRPVTNLNKFQLQSDHFFALVVDVGP